MSLRRWPAFWVLIGVMLAALGPIIGSALYLRSDAYRRICVEKLQSAVSLPVEIGRVAPRSRSAREFRDIVIYLPESRGRALTCQRAILRRTPSAGEPDGYEIDLFGGAAEISTRTWLRSDYRGVLESGLRPGFTPGGPRRVNFADMRVHLKRDSFDAVLSGAGGRIVFQDHVRGSATMIARALNGYPCPEPVRLTAEFASGGEQVRVERLELIAPELPIAITRIGALLGTGVEQGVFSGRLLYGETASGHWLVVSGRLGGLELAELTTGLGPQAWRGRVPQAELLELRAENRIPQRLRFRGRVEEAHLGDVLELAGIADVAGTLRLDIGEADLSASGIDRLVASGEVEGVGLEGLSRGLMRGEMTGALRIHIRDLTIINNRIESLEAEIRVADAGDEPNWIEGRLLRELARELFKVELPPLLPQRIPYTRLGLRLSVRDEQLLVFGSHGEGDRTILTIRLFGNDIPAVFEPSHAIDLRPALDALRHNLTARLQAEWAARELRRASTQPQ